MKVRVLGFSVETDGEPDLDEVMQSISSDGSNIPDEGESGRFVRIDSNYMPDFYLGLIVTVKDQRTFCQLQASDKKTLRVRVQDIDDGDQLMDFNFFIISKKTGCGLYQHYHQSCSINQAFLLMREGWNEVREQKIKKLTQEILGNGKIRSNSKDPQESARKRALKQLGRGKLSCDIMVRQEKLPQILEKMKRVKWMEVDLVTPVSKGSVFAPLDGSLKKERRRVTFKKKSSVSDLAHGVANVIDDDRIEKGRVAAIDENNVEQIFKIMDNPDSFGEYDYDDVAREIDGLELSNFKNTKLVKQLLKIAGAYPGIFGKSR